jgi:hypothetical protein
VRGVALLTLFAVAGCASDSSKRAEPANHSGVSARFTERTVYGGRDSFTETLRGAFDWQAKKGWAVQRSHGLQMRLVQLGRVCYRRFDAEPWKRFRANDVDGVCDADAFRNPATDDDLVRSVATGWEDLGDATVRGVHVRHYRGRLNIGAVKGPIELWVDGDGVARRELQRGEHRGDFVSLRDYFDLGATVRVKAPKLGAGG